MEMVLLGSEGGDKGMKECTSKRVQREKKFRVKKVTGFVHLFTHTNTHREKAEQKFI